MNDCHINARVFVCPTVNCNRVTFSHCIFLKGEDDWIIKGDDNRLTYCWLVGPPKPKFDRYDGDN